MKLLAVIVALCTVVACGVEPIDAPDAGITVATSAVINPCLINGVCESPRENATNCVNDCGCNHNGICEPSRTGETAALCGDCSVNCNHDAVCNGTETHTSCPSDCPAACDRVTNDMCVRHTFPLRKECSPTVAAVCAPNRDPYCCTTAWDNICVGEVYTVAINTVCGGTVLSNVPTCHNFMRLSTQTSPEPQPAGCGSEVNFICGGSFGDTFCCTNYWDGTCRDHDWVDSFRSGSPANGGNMCGDGVCSNVIHTLSHGDFATSETPNNCAYDCAR